MWGRTEMGKRGIKMMLNVVSEQWVAGGDIGSGECKGTRWG